MLRRVYIEIDEQGNHGVLPLTPPRKVSLRPVILVANSARTIIRTATLPDGYKLNAKTKWAQVLAAFPLGRALNEKTHLFDGSVYRNAEGRVIFCMVALPLEVSEAITEQATALPDFGGGNLKKIAAMETMETVLFRHFCTAQDTQNMPATQAALATRWVIYPCADGIKILIIRHNTPEAVRFLPLAPPHFEAALHRTLAENPPGEVILPTRPLWSDAWVHTRATLVQFFKSEAIKVTDFDL
ncbi:MAG: hypothetical protein FWC71_05105 [Defluviitaleaceae bacterium]|nr:hypothetical protein [Defluviitaleaceae bacterium]